MYSLPQGLTALITNPVLANGVAGLATSACSQATVQVCTLFLHACIMGASGSDAVCKIVAICMILLCAAEPHDESAPCQQCVMLVIQRMLLWSRRNNTVAPFNETVQQVFARISAFRDSLDGPQVRAIPVPVAQTACCHLGRSCIHMHLSWSC